MCPIKSSYLNLLVFLAMSAFQPPNADAAGMPKFEIVLTEILTKIFDRNVVAQNDFVVLSRDGRNIVNATFVYKRVMKELNMRIVVNFERPDKTRLRMLNITTDTCQLMTGKMSKHKFMQPILREFSKMQTFPYKCPLQANHAYSLVNFSLKLPQFPLPNMKFLALVVLLDEKAENRKLSEVRFKGVTRREAQ